MVTEHNIQTSTLFLYIATNNSKMKFKINVTYEYGKTNTYIYTQNIGINGKKR